MDDDKYMRKAPKLALQLCASHVRGVYEARLPLASVAALQLGCVMAVAQQAQRRPLGEGFALTDLQVRAPQNPDALKESGKMEG